MSVTLNGVVIPTPHLIRNWCTMCIQQITCLTIVARQMDFRHQLPRYTLQVFHHVKSVVNGIHIHVINIQQQLATRSLTNLNQKFSLIECTGLVFKIGGHIFNQHFLADDLQIGFMYSALLIGAILAATALLHYVSKLSPVVLFWIAFVLTRPFGATFGDLLTKSVDDGGLALGTVGASLIFTLMLGTALFFEIRRESAASGDNPSTGAGT